MIHWTPFLLFGLQLGWCNNIDSTAPITFSFKIFVEHTLSVSHLTVYLVLHTAHGTVAKKRDVFCKHHLRVFWPHKTSDFWRSEFESQKEREGRACWCSSLELFCRRLNTWTVAFNWFPLWNALCSFPLSNMTFSSSTAKSNVTTERSNVSVMRRLFSVFRARRRRIRGTRRTS